MPFETQAEMHTESSFLGLLLYQYVTEDATHVSADPLVVSSTEMLPVDSPSEDTPAPTSAPVLTSPVSYDFPLFRAPVSVDPGECPWM
jgi:hypothetical protein